MNLVKNIIIEYIIQIQFHSIPFQTRNTTSMLIDQVPIPSSSDTIRTSLLKGISVIDNNFDVIHSTRNIMDVEDSSCNV